MSELCDHFSNVLRRKGPIKPSSPGCVDCLRQGSEWVHLRLCMICGHVGCCDDSPNRHAMMHFHATGHPVIRSYEPDETWGYCFADDLFIEELRAFRSETASHHFSPPGSSTHAD